MSFGIRLAGALWVYYGLTLGMKAGAWGFFAPAIKTDIGLSTGDIGLVAGVVFGSTALFVPVAGFFIARFGTRKSMYLGLALGVFGILLTAAGTALWHFILGGVLLAASTSFGGVVPIQTLVTHWFKRLRSRVMAVVFTATPLWGAMSFQLYAFLLQYMTWRAAVAWITLIFPLGLLLVVFFFRDRPQEIGQEADGLPMGTTNAETAKAQHDELDPAVLRKAFLSPMFAFITLSVAISTLPYLFFTTYGRILLESLHLSTDVAVNALSLITLATAIGRLGVAVADFVEPVYLIVLTMIANILGLLILWFMPTPLMVTASSLLLGIGFGLGFLLAPILLGRYFHERLFTTLEGVRMSLVVGFNAVMTPLIGYMVDASGSFITSIILMVVVQTVALVGTVGFITQRRLTGGRLS